MNGNSFENNNSVSILQIQIVCTIIFRDSTNLVNLRGRLLAIANRHCHRSIETLQCSPTASIHSNQFTKILKMKTNKISSLDVRVVFHKVFALYDRLLLLLRLWIGWSSLFIQRMANNINNMLRGLSHSLTAKLFRSEANDSSEEKND